VWSVVAAEHTPGPAGERGPSIPTKPVRFGPWIG